MKTLPLKNVRVTDFSWQIAGPTCTRYLGAMGAEVIRVESNRRPDPYRERSISKFINQSKESVTLNLTDPKGLDLAKKLISVSDVVIENFAPGVIERLGLGYSDITRVRPEIVMLSSAGLGHTGPDMNQVAYGTLIQCFTGWSSVQGYPNGLPDIGGIWTDPMVGMLEVFLVNAALYQCWNTGKGQYIDLSMAEATTMLLPELILDYLMNGRIPQPMGNRDQTFAPHGNYPCFGTDQWIGISVTTESQWKSLCKFFDHTSLSQDPRFDDPIKRKQNEETLDKLISSFTETMDALDLMEKLQNMGIAAGPALPLDEFWTDKQLRHRNFFHTYQEMQDNNISLELPTIPWLINGNREVRITGQPVRGQHNEYVFNEILGISQDQTNTLKDQQIIF